MSNPQQPELARSRKTPGLDPDAAAGVAASGLPAPTEPAGPVPTENEPGHHPDEEQDKPDLDAFAARLGVATDDAPEDASPPEERRAEGAPAAGPTASGTATGTATSAPAASPPPRPLACQVVDLAVSSVRLPLGVLRALLRRLGQ